VESLEPFFRLSIAFGIKNMVLALFLFLFLIFNSVVSYLIPLAAADGNNSAVESGINATSAPNQVYYEVKSLVPDKDIAQIDRDTDADEDRDMVMLHDSILQRYLHSRSKSTEELIRILQINPQVLSVYSMPKLEPNPIGFVDKMKIFLVILYFSIWPITLLIVNAKCWNYIERMQVNGVVPNVILKAFTLNIVVGIIFNLFILLVYGWVLIGSKVSVISALLFALMIAISSFFSILNAIVVSFKYCEKL